MPRRWASSIDRAFFGLPMPSLSRSQFSPSTRASGWQVPQLCHFWKQSVASKKAISPRRAMSGTSWARGDRALEAAALDVDDAEGVRVVVGDVGLLPLRVDGDPVGTLAARRGAADGVRPAQPGQAR